MSKMIRISSLIQHFSHELNEMGLTEEMLENMVMDGTIQGRFDTTTGELLIDRESICTYINQSSHSNHADLKIDDELDEMEDFFNQPEWEG